MSTFAFPFGTKHKRSEQECKNKFIEKTEGSTTSTENENEER